MDFQLSEDYNFTESILHILLCIRHLAHYETPVSLT